MLGPPDTNRVAQHLQQYSALTGTDPSQDTIDGFIEAELRDELLFRLATERGLALEDPLALERLERNMRFLNPDDSRSGEALVSAALALNMHLTDPVIRRRLIQVMEQVIEASVVLPEMTEAHLRAAFDERQNKLTQSAELAFQQIFLGDTNEGAALELLEKLQSGELAMDDALALGRPLLAPSNFSGASWTEVTNRLGEEFERALKRSVTEGPVPGWSAPIRSAYGLHLVFISRFEQERALSFSEAKHDVKQQLLDEALQQAVLETIERLMENYQVLKS